VFLQAEQEYSRFNFEHADTEILLAHFRDAEKECKALLSKGAPSLDAPSDSPAGSRPEGAGPEGARHRLALPAYDQCIKASHIFNLLDARGVISVTERQSYILRVRELAKACCGAWLATDGGGA
jgi:glycyl-tRNA synthetase alpha chain